MKHEERGVELLLQVGQQVKIDCYEYAGQTITITGVDRDPRLRETEEMTREHLGLSPEFSGVLYSTDFVFGGSRRNITHVCLMMYMLNGTASLVNPGEQP